MAARTDSPHHDVFEGVQIFRLPDDYPKCLGHPVSAAGMSSGKEVLEWYLGFLSGLSTLGTLGAGFTLSVVVQAPTAHNRGNFSPTTVTTWAAISSILFVLTVLVCQGCTQLFKLQHKLIVKGIDRDDHAIKHGLVALSLLLETQVLGAFLFLEMVVAAHAPVVGFVGIGLTSCFALGALWLWGVQVVRWWPSGRHWMCRKRGCGHDRGSRV